MDEVLYHSLLQCSRQSPLSPFLAQILCNQRAGTTALPTDLGLGEQLNPLLAHCFALTPELKKQLTPSNSLTEKDQLLLLLYSKRHDERDQLRDYLCATSSPLSREQQEQLATLIATASLGSAHLWHALGMTERPELTRLMQQLFPEIAKQNDKGMRWKKFFYRQLCQMEGGYLCRSPSCDECKSYSECFAEGEH